MTIKASSAGSNKRKKSLSNKSDGSSRPLFNESDKSEKTTQTSFKKSGRKKHSLPIKLKVTDNNEKYSPNSTQHSFNELDKSI